jgi:hypothetical protein
MIVEINTNKPEPGPFATDAEYCQYVMSNAALSYQSQYKTATADEGITAAREAYNASLPNAEPPPPRIPRAVTRFQAKAALMAAGMLDKIDAAAATSDDPIFRLAWSEAGMFDRDSPMVKTIAAAFGMSEQELDQLFLEASKIAV